MEDNVNIWLYRTKTGGARKQINGQSAQITNILTGDLIDVLFEDGTLVVKQNYMDFYQGFVMNPNHCGCHGEVYMNYHYNEQMEIIKYGEHGYVDVMFEDGETVEHVFYGCVRLGNVRKSGKNSGHWTYNYEPFIGEKQRNQSGIDTEVIHIKNEHHILVRFSDNRVTETTLRAFRLGSVKHNTLSVVRNHLNPGSYYGNMNVLDMVQHQPDNTSYYYCKCRTCGHTDILTPQEMLEHKCMLR